LFIILLMLLGSKYGADASFREERHGTTVSRALALREPPRSQLCFS
jgi:hypothetical protein